MADEKDKGLLDDIREFRDREPFEAFAIVMSSGDKYVIESPGNLAFGKTRMFYVNPATDRWVITRYNQISSVELQIRPGKKRRRSA